MTALGVLTPRRARQLWYVPLLAAATGLMMVRLLVLAKLLDMEAFGRLSAALLISSTFGMLGCLGLQALLQRDMPIMYVRGRERAARVLLGQCVTAAYACVAVALLVGLAWSGGSGASTWVVALGLLHGLSQQLFLVASVESRSRGEPLRFALQSLLRSVLIIGAGVAVAAFTGSAAGVVGAEAAVSLLLAHGMLWQILRAGLPGAWGSLRVAVGRWARIDWRAALVLLLVSLLAFVLMYADRWAAAALLEVRSFAVYAFAGMVIAIGISVQALVNASVYPMLARLYGRAGRAACYALCSSISLYSLAVTLLLAVPAHFALAEAVRRWYPAYESAVALLPAFLVVAAFRVSDFWASYMIITGLQDKLLKTNLLAGAAGAAIWGVFARSGEAGQLSPQQFAWLAIALCVVDYAAVAMVAWRAAKNGPAAA